LPRCQTIPVAIPGSVGNGESHCPIHILGFVLQEDF
jgi:hypothetical protein